MRILSYQWVIKYLRPFSGFGFSKERLPTTIISDEGGAGGGGQYPSSRTVKSGLLETNWERERRGKKKEGRKWQRKGKWEGGYGKWRGRKWRGKGIQIAVKGREKYGTAKGEEKDGKRNEGKEKKGIEKTRMGMKRTYTKCKRKQGKKWEKLN